MKPSTSIPTFPVFSRISAGKSKIALNFTLRTISQNFDRLDLTIGRQQLVNRTTNRINRAINIKICGNYNFCPQTLTLSFVNTLFTVNRVLS